MTTWTDFALRRRIRKSDRRSNGYLMEDIKVEVRNVCGRESFYPVNGTAKIFAQIAGTKTIKPETIMLVKILGYTVSLIRSVSEDDSNKISNGQSPKAIEKSIFAELDWRSAQKTSKD